MIANSSAKRKPALRRKRSSASQAGVASAGGGIGGGVMARPSAPVAQASARIM
jgi:hypothetical protein